MLCLVGSGWCSSVTWVKMVSKWIALLWSNRVCAVESGSMSVVSGKLKSPAMKVVQVCGGGMCFLTVLRTE